MLLDGLSYRRAVRMVGFSKTEVDDSLDLLLGELAAGEAVVVDGLATRLQRPRGWASQKVLYDAKRHTPSAQGLGAVHHGDLLWCDGGRPGSRHEHETF